MAFELIEASAGTGKTYSITSRYLLLLIEQRLQVGQILVVTFTEAATQSCAIASARAFATCAMQSRHAHSNTLEDKELLARLKDLLKTDDALVQARSAWRTPLWRSTKRQSSPYTVSAAVLREKPSRRA